jgi:bifunctional UDP-N-acetylglucosamine pyrophosphorylase/glucosamine-1-phosphate N-acetyltransferase
VTCGTLYWAGEDAPADAEVVCGSPEEADVLTVYLPCPLVTAETWARVTGTLTAGGLLLAERSGEGETLCPEGEAVCTESAAGFAEALRRLRQRVNHRLLDSGVLLWDPENAYIAPEAVIGPGTQILPGCQIIGKTVVGTGCQIGPYTLLQDAVLGDKVTVNQSQVLESAIGSGTSVGPFAYIRPGSKVGAKCKVGDFVELKKATIGDGTKIAHLTYVGDADLGKRVNIGCGTVFANYDGKNKFRSTVGDDVFIGCNTNLISPVSVADGVYIATGTTISEDVTEPESLVIGRPRQNVKPGWVKKRRDSGKL